MTGLRAVFLIFKVPNYMTNKNNLKEKNLTLT